MRRAPETLRPILAVLAAAVWVGGFELAPALHVALHEVIGAHRHEGEADSAAVRGHYVLRVATAYAPRAGGSRAMEHAHPHGEHADRDGERTQVAPGSGHGAHSLAHRTLATQVAPPMLPPVPPPAMCEVEWPVRAPRSFAIERAERPRARAPPAAA